MCQLAALYLHPFPRWRARSCAHCSRASSAGHATDDGTGGRGGVVVDHGDGQQQDDGAAGNGGRGDAAAPAGPAAAAAAAGAAAARPGGDAAPCGVPRVLPHGRQGSRCRVGPRVVVRDDRWRCCWIPAAPVLMISGNVVRPISVSRARRMELIKTSGENVQDNMRLELTS
jgi:hypothetical protein